MTGVDNNVNLFPPLGGMPPGGAAAMQAQETPTADSLSGMSGLSMSQDGFQSSQSFMSGSNSTPGYPTSGGSILDVMNSLMVCMGTVMQQLQECIQVLTSVLGNKAVTADSLTSPIQNFANTTPEVPQPKAESDTTAAPAEEAAAPAPATTADVQALYDKWLPEMTAMAEADRKPFIDYVVARAKDIPGSPKPDWIMQIVKIESGFNPKASNDFEEGHFGLFQIKGEPHLMDVTPREQMGRWVDFLKSKAAVFGPMDNVDTLMKAQSGGYTIEATWF